MYRIGGRRRSEYASIRGVAVGIPPFQYRRSNYNLLSRFRTLSGGQFDWGGRLPKSNGGAQRFSQCGWKSRVECKGRRELDCETDKSSKYESRT